MSLHHFSFSAPHYLLTLVVVPSLVAFTIAVRRRRLRYTVAFTNLSMLAGIAERRHVRRRRYVPLIFLALALATAAAALAQPQIELIASDRGATIILLADVSGSMQATDVHPARIYAAITAMHGFVDVLPENDKVGLLTFSDKVEVLDRPTTDHTLIHSGLDILRPEGGTALGAGVEAAVKMVLASLAADGVHHTPGEYLPAAIVLESDGAQDRGAVTPFAAAQLAKAAGVRIYGVTLGTRHGYIAQGTGLLSQSVRVLPDPGTIAMLARETGGQAFTATNADRLNTIYRDLGSSIARHPELREITSWFELAAAALLITGVGAARVQGPALP